MHIHIGGDRVIYTNELIAILDSSVVPYIQEKDNHTSQTSSDNKSNIVYITKENPKSIVITVKEIYYSPISSSTLKKRLYL
ncbi:extracellular matrix regulator RemB [Longirhabdus pacifica]|uniref:extracellular matrix regulator RemB n=1 Tax=Longirhabdus pacifica TaxID=2305227 RepID=UPI001008EA51|nr:extracellular matrix/biofilm biosynthesis regulator RemA family protein [Longirhabdus pacifica]